MIYRYRYFGVGGEPVFNGLAEGGGFGEEDGGVGRRGAAGLVFRGSHGFDVVEGLEQGMGEGSAREDPGDAKKVIRAGNGRQVVFAGQQMGKTAEELSQERAANLAKERGVGEELEGEHRRLGSAILEFRFLIFDWTEGRRAGRNNAEHPTLNVQGRRYDRRPRRNNIEHPTERRTRET